MATYRVIVTNMETYTEAQTVTSDLLEAMAAVAEGSSGDQHIDITRDGMGMSRSDVKAEFATLPVLSLDDLYMIGFAR